MAEEYAELLRRDGVPALLLNSAAGRSAAALRVGTYQRTKGLEFRHVVVPRLDKRTLLLTAGGRDARAGRKELARRVGEALLVAGPIRLGFCAVTTLPLSDAKARLSQIADEVDRTHERVHITKNGRDYVVLISAEDLASIEATLELLSDPEAQERLRRAEAEVRGGDVVEEDELRHMLDRLRRS